MLYQLVTGIPLQNELPIKSRCKTVKGETIFAPPVFGYYQQEQMSFDEYVDHTIKMQEKHLKSIDFFLDK